MKAITKKRNPSGIGAKDFLSFVSVSGVFLFTFLNIYNIILYIARNF